MITKSDKTERLDETLMILTCMITLFSTDTIGGQLEQKAEVEALQQKYAALLWNYLKAKAVDKHNKQFHKGLMISNAAEEAYEITLKRLTI